MLQSKLASIIFFCPVCPPQQQTFRYDDIIKHLKSECPNRKVQCPNRYCNESKAAIELLKHLRACPKTQVKCKNCVVSMNQENVPAHNCSGMLTERLKKKEMEIKDLKELLWKASNKFDTVFTKYYPQEYQIKDEDKQRMVSAFEFYRKEQYPVFKQKNPGIPTIFRILTWHLEDLMPDIIKKLGEAWSAMTEYQKQPYQLQAKKVNLDNEIVMVGKRTAFTEERQGIKQLIAQMKTSGNAGYRPSIEEEKDELEPAKKRPKLASQNTKLKSTLVKKKTKNQL